jgi:hypothetical protein
VDIDQIGISRRYRRLARQKTPAWLPASADRSGLLVGDN